MADTSITLATGRDLGSRPSRRLRATDTVPGVIYGFKTAATPVSVPRRELRSALTTEAGMNALLSVSLEGQQKVAVVRDLQRDPVRNTLLHVDLLAIDPKAEIVMEIRVVLVGEAEAVGQVEGGTVEQGAFTLSVTTQPDNIPNEIPVDISGLEIGQAVRVRDLDLGPGIAVNADPEEILASATIIQEAPEEPVEGEEELLEGEEMVEGEETAEGEEPSDGDDA